MLNLKLKLNSAPSQKLSRHLVIFTFSLFFIPLVSLAFTEDLSCVGCQLSANNQEGLDFETPESCGPQRNYLANALQELSDLDVDGDFIGTRNLAITSKILPRKCVLYTLRSFWKDRGLTSSEKRISDMLYNVTANYYQQKKILPIDQHPSDPALYARCEKAPLTEPIRELRKACVTEDYVNMIYNSLLDVADCFQVPAKFIIPKLANESGLHINAYGLVNDGGIGQFTEQALKDVQQNYSSYLGIINSGKASCQRLKSIPGALVESPDEIQTSDKQRCHAISAPTNPIRSLVYYAIFYKATKRNANSAWNNQRDYLGRNAEALLNEFYFSRNNDTATEIATKTAKIKDMLFVMSYNAGPANPAKALVKWLNYREPMLRKYPIKDRDFNMNFWPDKSLNQFKRGQDRIDAYADLVYNTTKNKSSNRQNPPLTFAEYLFAVYDSKYIALVKAQANKLNKVMGQNVCVEENFLEF